MGGLSGSQGLVHDDLTSSSYLVAGGSAYKLTGADQITSSVRKTNLPSDIRQQVLTLRALEKE